MNEVISIEDAVREIVQACPCDPAAGEVRPFVFIVGAGISTPSVPLSSEIEDLCRKKAETDGVGFPPTSFTPAQRYSYWFAKAYPHPAQRQRFLKNLIDKKPITFANFRLAQLLMSRRLGNFAITTNFDDFLSRALSVFGEESVLVCDDPSVVNRLDLAGDGLQIIHVHGTYRFYDLANLTPEIEGRAQAAPDTVMTMLSALDTVFRDHSPIVLGYAGWENDVVMSALRRRLNATLPYRMYWFCHRRSVVTSLPSWLTRHREVVLCAPPETPESGEASQSPGDGIEALDRSKPESECPSESRAEAISDDNKDTLDAHVVLDRLISRLGLEAPALLRDPLGFFADRIGKSLPEEGANPTGDEAFSFASVIGSVNKARKLLQRATAASGHAETLLERVKDAVRRSDYETALRTAQNISVEDLDE